MSFRKAALVLFCSLALLIQGLPVGPMMVGCSMAQQAANCSKWTEPGSAKCCCRSGHMMGGACCRPVASSLSQLKTSFAAGRQEGCQCRFIVAKTAASPVKAEHPAKVSPHYNAAVLPSLDQIFAAPRLGERGIVGTDSDPPGTRPRLPNRARSPPICA